MASRTVENSLQQLLTICQTVATMVVSPYQFLTEPNIPGGTIDPAVWGIPFPIGLWTNEGYTQTFRESGEVGSVEGRPNQYLLRLLDSPYQAAAGRITSRAQQLTFFDAFKDAIVAPNGVQCFDGVVWATVALEKPEFLTYAGVQYVGAFIVVSLDERYL